MLNRCEFIGHLGRQAEIKTLAENNKVANFSLAVTKKGYKTANGTEVPEKTLWINVVAWRRLAELVEKYTTKGSKIFLSGELQTREYEKEGVKITAFEIVADNIELLDSKGSSEGSSKGASKGASPSTSKGEDWHKQQASNEFASGVPSGKDEDLPF